MGWNDFRLAAVGTRYDNDDGTSRQEELARCLRGEAITLLREPTNEHDPRAVAIMSCRGICLGYLSRDHAGWVGSKIDRGYDVRAIVDRVKGIDLSDSPLGLVVLLNMDGGEPEPEIEGAAGHPWADIALRSEAA